MKQNLALFSRLLGHLTRKRDGLFYINAFTLLVKQTILLSFNTTQRLKNQRID